MTNEDSTGWTVRTEYHWQRDINGVLVDYWPSTRTFRLNNSGNTHIGDARAAVSTARAASLHDPKEETSEIDRLRAALTRLASGLAFHVGGMTDPEARCRLRFAKEVVEDGLPAADFERRIEQLSDEEHQNTLDSMRRLAERRGIEG